MYKETCKPRVQARTLKRRSRSLGLGSVDYGCSSEDESGAASAFRQSKRHGLAGSVIEWVPAGLCIVVALFGLGGCGDQEARFESGNEPPGTMMRGPGEPAQVHGPRWSVGRLVDSWGDPTDRRFAAVTIEHEVSGTARLIVADDAVTFRFGTVYLPPCIDVGDYDRICSLDVRVGDHIATFNVVEEDGTVAPPWPEDGASKLLQGMILAAVTNGDAELRARLAFAGRGKVVFRFPMLGACDALATIGLITPPECDRGGAYEPVLLGEWEENDAEGGDEFDARGRGGFSRVKLAYHQPTELEGFWILSGWWWTWDTARRTYERPIWPGHFSWMEVASSHERERRFESVHGGDYLVVEEDGKVRGVVGDVEYRSFEASYVAPKFMEVGKPPADQQPALPN